MSRSILVIGWDYRFWELALRVFTAITRLTIYCWLHIMRAERKWATLRDRLCGKIVAWNDACSGSNCEILIRFWMNTFSVMRKDHMRAPCGAKHSPPGSKFHKSRHPPASGPGPSEIRISKVKSHPNEAFSIDTLIIFDVDSNCIHPRFWMWALMVDLSICSNRILRFLRKSTYWNQALWYLVVSNIILGESWCLSKSSNMFWFIFNNVDFWWFLVDFWCSHVRGVLRTASPLQEECPKCDCLRSSWELTTRIRRSAAE